MWSRFYGNIASFIVLLLILQVADGGNGRVYGNPNLFSEGIAVGATTKKDLTKALAKKLYIQKTGSVDQHNGIYKMKRIRCDWDGDGQLNRPDWAGAMKTQTTERKSAMANNEGDRDNTQIMADAIIIPMHADCRPEPKKPWNGFPTGANTGLTRGRIIPFQLGGINSRANIVPINKGWNTDGGGWLKMTESIVKYVSEIYGWSRPPKDYEVYRLNQNGESGWDSSAEFNTPEIIMKMVVDLNPDWSDGYNQNNNLEKSGVPMAYEIRLIPEPKGGNECLLRRIDIEADQDPEYFAWSGTSWVSLTSFDLGDPYVDNLQKSLKTAKDEAQLADIIAKGMKANGFLNNYGSRRRQLGGKFCIKGGKNNKNCKCDPKIHGANGKGGKECDALDTAGYTYCYVKPGVCTDGKPSSTLKRWHYSIIACSPKTATPKKKLPRKVVKDPNVQCECDDRTDSNNNGGSDCSTTLYGVPWCYTKINACKDGKSSKKLTTHDWSKKACEDSGPAIEILEKKMHKQQCKCAGVKDKAQHGGSDCKSVWEEKNWCYVGKKSCEDGRTSKVMRAYDYSHDACVPKKVLAAAITSCKCDGTKDKRGAGGKDCKSVWEENNWCFTAKGACKDGKPSKTHTYKETSNLACEYEKARQALTTTKAPPPPPPIKPEEKKKTDAPTPAPTDRRHRKPNKVLGKDDNCECDGVEDHDGNGGDDCLSKFDQKPWCYVQTGECHDGQPSKTLKSHDWSFLACVDQGEPGEEEDECEWHKNGKCPPGCLKGPKETCINGGKPKGKKEALVMISPVVARFKQPPYLVLFIIGSFVAAFLTFLWRCRQRKGPASEALLMPHP